VKKQIVVLDDDPTGTQTVHDVAVLTKWDEKALAAEFAERGSLLYLLTNTRAFSVERAEEINRTTGIQLAKAAQMANVDLRVISRSDSTLRGHFPKETNALSEGLGVLFDGVILCPAFIEGGRITVDDTHYLLQRGVRTPVSETEFARDRSFGYKASNLVDWVAEKYGGICPPTIVSLSPDSGSESESLEKLLKSPKGSVFIANAASYQDLDVLVRMVSSAENLGKQFLFRTAASWVTAYADVAPRPYLRSLGNNARNGGLIIVGSYVDKTTRQLNQLLERLPCEHLKLSLDAFPIGRLAAKASELLSQGKTVILCTSRDLSMAGDLNVGSQISGALVQVVSALTVRPAYILAKGGITSSDIATGALEVVRAWVEGQLCSGVSVWRLGPESKWPDMAYVVFPGNVGEDGTLADVVCQLVT
jgi:uncharacterized protein YgbK (DUF1537 family)